MKCPHCGKDIKDSVVMSAAGAIQGRRGRRKLSPEQAREMQLKAAEARRRNREGREG